MVLDSFSKSSGRIRVLIATIAFDMGADAKGVHKIVHFGPAKNVEAYMQESGRAGRDGVNSIAVLFYNSKLNGATDNAMKSYIQSTECRRKILLQHFETVATEIQEHPVGHLCCDNCRKSCRCAGDKCSGPELQIPVAACGDETASQAPVHSRLVSAAQEMVLKGRLVEYRKITFCGSNARGWWQKGYCSFMSKLLPGIY